MDIDDRTQGGAPGRVDIGGGTPFDEFDLPLVIAQDTGIEGPGPRKPFLTLPGFHAAPGLGRRGLGASATCEQVTAKAGCD